MKHLIGIEANSSKKPVFIDTSQLINSHGLVCGLSGSGKSHQLRKLIDSAIRQGLTVDVFDAHDDLGVAGMTSAIYSEATKYGLNPLKLSTDPHAGGVRKNINQFIGLLNSTSRQLGPKQIACLRYLLQDIYFLNGILDNNPRTWAKQEITETERAALLEKHDYASLKNYYPTMADLTDFAKRKLKTLYIGGDNKAVAALEKVNRLAAKINGLVNRLSKAANDEEVGKLEKQLHKAKDDAVEVYSDYISAIEDGREFNALLKYSSKEVLLSVIERLDALNASGVFSANPAPFNGATARRHRIKALSHDEQILFLQTYLSDIFQQRKARGITEQVEHLIVVDEAHLYLNENDNDSMLAVLARESRKYGIGLWCGSQSPGHFNLDFLTNVAVTILLRTHSSFWDGIMRKLQIEKETLIELDRQQRLAAVKLQHIQRATHTGFTRTSVDDEVIRQYIAEKKKA